MSDSPKIHIDELHVGLRPEEIDSILGLRNTFDYFELLSNYVTSYLELGWLVKLVIPQFDVALDIDLREVREVWHQGLTNLALKGIHACLMVYTGSTSQLLVLEVAGKSAEKTLALGRDWRAACVVQVGPERERHFYSWPEFLAIPAEATVPNLDLQIYGEGGKVALPPSLPTGSVEPSHWLIPPWEKPPAPPSPRLLDFLRSQFPATTATPEVADAEIPAWEEVLNHIMPHPRLMQTMLTPQPVAEEYYRTLLATAREAGLQDPNLLLGLLWHAPLGVHRQQAESLPWFQELILGQQAAPTADQEESPALAQVQQQLAALLEDLQKTMASLKEERQRVLQESFRPSHSFAAGSDQQTPGGSPPRHFAQMFDQESSPPQAPPISRAPRPPIEWPSVSVFQSSPFAQGEIPVNRKQYEAMIYELGRLAAMEKVNSHFVRESSSLRAKLEKQRQAEIDSLRQLVRERKPKKWWER